MTVPASQTQNAASLSGVVGQSTTLLSLAWPVMLSRAGILVMSFVDIAMLGRHDGAAVAVFNLGLAIFIPVMVFLIGLTTGLVPEISRAHATGARMETGRAWRRGLCWGIAVSVFGIWASWHTETLLLLFGQTPGLAADAGAVGRALAPGLVGQVIFIVCAFYLEATHRPHFALAAMVIANIVNALFNWVLIYGLAGWPELGAVGAALGTSAARLTAAAAMIVYIYAQTDGYGAGVRGPWETLWGPGGWRAGATMRRLGFSAGLSNGFETVGFAGTSLIAGTLGTLPLAAYAIAHNVMSVVFMIGLGLSVATGVLVADAAARPPPRPVRLAGWTGVGTAVVLIGTLAIGVALGRDEIARAYTDDPVLLERSAALLIITALVLVPDALQIVLGQAVRALGDAWFAVAAYAFAFTIVMVPLALAAVHILGTDERGLAGAIAFCCVLAALLLGARFQAISRRSPS